MRMSGEYHMVRHMKPSLLVATLIGFLVWVPSAHAGKAEARDAFRKGTQHYNLGEYKEAFAAFKDAYRYYEDPSFLFNIGQCQRQLDQKRDAIRSFKAYLRESQNAPNRVEVEKLIASLETALREEQAGSPPIGTMPPNRDAAQRPTPLPESSEHTGVVQKGPETRTPVYKKWWLWTAVGAVAVGLAVGLGVGLTQSSSVQYPSAMAPDGTFRF
jgi:tetratricopeptide (TPR) repeat protein